MALKKTINLQGTSFIDVNGSAFNKGEVEVKIDAYIKVAKMTGDKNKQICYVHLIDGEGIIQQQYEFVPDMDGPNFIKQAYLYLKTLPEFAGAVDC